MIEHETDAQVTVIAEYQAHAGRGDEVAMVLARHVTATRAEPGCVNFTAYRDPEDPDHFALYEKYIDENAFQAHRKSAHFVAFVEGQIVPLLLDRSWRRYHEVPAVGAALAKGEISVRMIGGPTAVLEIGGLRLVTDPTFDEPRDYPIGPGRVLSKTASPAIGPAEIGEADAVLLSHDQHPDNLDLSGRGYLNQVPLVLTTASAAARLGGNCRELALWQHTDLPRPDGGTLRVTRTPAQHGPDGTEHLTGEVAGFVLSGTGMPTVYVSGDNASLDVVRAIAGRLGPIDIAVLFAGAARTPLLGDAYLTLTSDQAAQAAQILGASQVIPLHYDGWGHFTEGAGDLRTAFTRAGLTERLTLLAPGRSTPVEAGA